MRHYVTVTMPSGRVKRYSHIHDRDRNGVVHWRPRSFRWER